MGRRTTAIKELTSVEELITETPLNRARLHTDSNLAMITEGLQEVGAARSIVIDEKGHVLAGKGTTLAALQAGINKLRVIDAEGDELIAVRRKGLTKREKIRLAIFDNRAAELSEWDPGELAPLAEAGFLDGLLELEALPGLDLDPDLLQDLEAASEATSETAAKASLQDDDLPAVPDALFPSDPEWGIPLLDLAKQADVVNLPALIWGASSRKVHAGTWLFYTEDYRYSKLWKSPNDLLQTGCLTAAEPNYSCYEQMPPAVALYRIFQKRWIARYWQEQGVKIFVDLNVNPAFYDLNFLGVPPGWRAYATRGYSDRIPETMEEFERAKTHAGSSSILFVVYGGGQKVKQAAARAGWVWIPEVMDVRKGREAAYGQE